MHLTAKGFTPWNCDLLSITCTITTALQPQYHAEQNLHMILQA